MNDSILKDIIGSSQQQIIGSQKFMKIYADSEGEELFQHTGFKQEKTIKQKEMENTENQNEENQLEGMNIIDWLKIKEDYPLSVQAVQDWFVARYDIPDAEVIIDQYSILITNGVGGMYLNIRDLYDFFDVYNVRPFVVPEGNFPNVKYIIQSKKSIIESEVVFEERAAAEIAMFIETFQYIEVTIEHYKIKATNIGIDDDSELYNKKD